MIIYQTSRISRAGLLLYNNRNNRNLSLGTINVFQFNKNSAKQLRSGNHLQRTNMQAVYFGSQYITALGANISDLISAEIKTSKSLNTFKK